jgi:hypothetical protein
VATSSRAARLSWQTRLGSNSSNAHLLRVQCAEFEAQLPHGLAHVRLAQAAQAAADGGQARWVAAVLQKQRAQARSAGL